MERGVHQLKEIRTLTTEHYFDGSGLNWPERPWQNRMPITSTTHNRRMEKPIR
jgi:hypothetical protein